MNKARIETIKNSFIVQGIGRKISSLTSLILWGTAFIGLIEQEVEGMLFTNGSNV